MSLQSNPPIAKTWLLCLCFAGSALACTDDGMSEDTSMDAPGDGDADSSSDTGDGDGDGDGDPSGDGDGDGDPSGDGDGDPSGDGDGDTGGLAEFAEVYQILELQGCTAGYCHGAGQGGLTMTDAATSYMNLVGVDATTSVCGLQQRVVPGDPDQSIMWRRVRPLAMDMGMACADKMPQGTDGLPDAEAQVVYDWIAGGALP